MIKTGEITATRLGKPVVLTVEVKCCGDAPLHVRKVDGKPLYGTTGYIRKFNGEITIGNYSGRDIILDNVQGLEVFCDIDKVSEGNRELWINGYPPNRQPNE